MSPYLPWLDVFWILPLWSVREIAVSWGEKRKERYQDQQIECVTNLWIWKISYKQKPSIKLRHTCPILRTGWYWWVSRTHYTIATYRCNEGRAYPMVCTIYSCHLPPRGGNAIRFFIMYNLCMYLVVSIYIHITEYTSVYTYMYIHTHVQH